MVRRAQTRPRQGFTLMEVLLVLVILVILGSLAVTYFTGVREKAFEDAARAQIGLVERATDMFQMTLNAYPQSLEELMVPPSGLTNPKKWRGPYLDRRVPLDPWDNEYHYLQPGKRNPYRFDMWSVGPDGEDGTDDDIGNWE